MVDRTNVLVWNLRFFQIGKITTFTRPAPDLPDPTWDPGLYRNYNDMYLGYTVAQLDPDIFVVLEVLTTAGSRGTLIAGTGQQGLAKLLSDLRLRNRNWQMVPAVRANAGVAGRYTEGVGVFYRSDRLQFTGPMVWPNPSTNKFIGVPLVPGVNSNTYPEPFTNCLPDNPLTVNGIQLNENRMAGQAKFLNAKGNEVGFPMSTSRSPFLTTFMELHPPNRQIALASVHLPTANKTSPDGKSNKGIGAAAKSAIAAVMRHIPMISNPPANTVSIVAGDFNLNRNVDTVERDLYGRTMTQETEWGFVTGQKSMYQAINNATHEGYLGPALNDNMLVRYGAGLAIPSSRRMIPDIVAGTSDNMGVYNPPLPAVPSTIIPSIGRYPSLAPDVDKTATFQDPLSYGHVAHEQGLSDHRPIYFEV